MSIKDLPREALEKTIINCYTMFRDCLSLLNGEDIEEPVVLPNIDEMGDSDDLELFYKCKDICRIINLKEEDDEEQD